MRIYASPAFFHGKQIRRHSLSSPVKNLLPSFSFIFAIQTSFMAFPQSPSWPMISACGKSSCLPFQNKLFSQTKQVKSRRETSCFGFRLVDTIVRDNRENAKRHQDCHAYREPSCRPRRKYASQQPYPPSSGTYPGYVLTHFLADPILPRSL